MTVKDLNRDQLAELKQNLLAERLDKEEGRSPSYGELANIDELVSDDTVFSAYDGVEFGEEDFFCSLNKEAFHD